jgi:hypothetical protein
MKFFRTAIILGIIAVIAVFSYWFFEVKKKGEKKKVEEQEALLFGKKDVKIVKLILKQKGSESVVIEWMAEKPQVKEAGESAGESSTAESSEVGEAPEEKGQWMIKAPVETRGDKIAIDSMIKSLESSKRDSVIYENLEKQSEYKLDQPELSLRFYYRDDPKEYGIDFGVASLDRKKVFAKLAGENRIIAVPIDVKSALSKSLFDLRDKTLAPFEKEDIEGVSILYGREFIVMKKEGDTWYLLPHRIKAAESRVDIYTGTLRWGSFVEVMEEKGQNFSKYGLDRPRLVVTMKLKDNSNYMFIVGNPVDGEQPKFFYATRSSDQMIFQVQADTVQKLVVTEFYLKDRSIFDFKQDIVKAVKLNYNEMDLYFEKKDEDWYYIPKDEAEAARLKKLLPKGTSKKGEEAVPGIALTRGYKIDNIIRGIVAAEYEEKEPLKKGQADYIKTGIDSPKYRVTLHFSDGREPLTVLLTAKDEQSGKLYLSPDNGNTAYYTSGYFTASFPEKLEELFE